MKFFNLLLSAIVISLFVVTDINAQDITGTVWEDTNGNGIMDGGEAGLAGVQVELQDQFGTPVGINTTTDGVGDYTLTGGVAGTMYQIYFDIPSYDPNYVACLPNQGGDPAMDSDMNQGGSFNYGAFTLMAGGLSDIDAGVFVTVEIGDLVWLDENGNGLDDEGGVALPANVDVTLEQEFPLGSGTWVTAQDYMNMPLPANPINTNSNFNFVDISPGNYRVVFADGSAGSMYFTYEDITGGNTQASDATDDSDARRVDGTSHEITLLSGDPAYLQADAGYFTATSVEGIVWEDQDGDGLDNEGGAALPANVNVTLQYDDPVGGGWIDAVDQFDGNPIPVNPINTNNAYIFDMLPPGTYRIVFEEPGDVNPADLHLTIQHVNDGGAPPPGDDVDDSDADRQTGGTNGRTMDFDLVLNSTENVTDIDAGYFLPVRIGDFVFEDLNWDGDQTGDGPLDIPIDISLFRMDLGDVPALDVDGNPYPVPVNQDGAGIYEFFPLPPGEYQMQFDWLEPDVYPTQMDMVADDLDSDIMDCQVGGTPGTSRTPTTAFLFSDDEDLTIDAGFFKPVRISDFVFEDLAGDGRSDGDPGLDGVQIEIFEAGTLAPVDYADCTPTAGTVTSAGGGQYEFVDLRPGSYVLQFIAPTVPVQFYHTQYNVLGGPDFPGDVGNDSDSDGMNSGYTFTIDVVSNDDIDIIDAGFFRSGSIGDFCWEDLNGDGIQDGPEPGLGGVNISILDVNSGAAPIDLVTMAPVPPTVSAGDGSYIFENLPPGMYELTFSAVAPYLYTRDNQTGGPDDATDTADDSDAVEANGGRTHVIELESGESLESGNPEEDIDAGFVEPVTVEGRIWHDGNADGIQDGSEGLPVPAGTVVTVIDVILGGVANDISGNPAVVAIPPGGDYAFTGVTALKPGLYDIQLTVPGGWFVSEPDQTGDAADSDFDPGSLLLVNQLNMESGDMEMNVDGGIWTNILVGGFVFGDGDGDCLFGPTETGYPNDVILSIMNADGDEFPQVFTDNDGFYCFEVPPGIYDISVMADNFTDDTQPLYQLIPCDGGQDPNSDTPLDNNGSGGPGGPSDAIGIELICGEEPGPGGVENKTIDFGFQFDCDAENNPFALLTCEEAAENPLCNVLELEQGCGTMPNIANPQGPSPLCPGGGGIPHNTSWFSFIAGYGDYDIEIALNGCNPGTGGSTGIQSGLYLYDPDNANCWGNEAPYCEDACLGGNITLDGAGLIPGNQYVMFLDGCNGSWCGYEINVLGNYIPFIVNEADEMLCNGDVACDVICPGTTIEFEAQDADLTYDELENLLFRWSLKDEFGNIIDDFLTNGNADFETMENIISITFDQVGIYELCLDEIADICDNVVPSDLCQIIEVIEFEDEDFGIVEICGQDLFAYNGPTSVNDEGVIFDPNMDGLEGWQLPGTFFQYGENSGIVLTALGCEYEQTVEIVEIFDNFGDIDTAVCGLSEFPLTFLDFSTNTPVEGLVWIGQDMAANGCDSILSIDAYNLEVDGDFSFDCAPGGFSITFTETSNSIEGTWPIETNVEWTDSMGNVIDPVMGDDYTVIVPSGGTYYFTITFNTNFNSGAIEITCPYVFEYDLDPGDLAPAMPTANNWENQFCEYDNIFTYIGETDEDPMNVISYNWYYPSDATVVSGLGTDSLTLDWSGSMGGEVCFSVTNECGEGPRVCDTISIVPTPVAAIAPFDTICVDSLTSALFPGTQDPDFTYAWNFGGGNPVGGTNVPGPIDVSWSEPGDKIVSLSINKFGCVSDIDSAVITVVEPVNPPTITCTSTQDQVTFMWTDPPGATGVYIPNIEFGGGTGTLNGNEFIVSGLMVGDSVAISLITETNSPCGSLLSLGNCLAQDCPIYFVNPDPVADICFDANTNTIDLTLQTDNPNNYTLNWNHPAITDPAAGTFDPKLADVGANTITVTLVDEFDCTYNNSLIIDVNPIPTSDFIGEDVICEDSTSTIQYTGSVMTGGQFDWTFGDVVAPGNGMGPFDVQWLTPGDKTVTLTVTQAGCVSEETTFPITVEPRIEPLDLDCDGTATTVDISWGALDNVTDYTIIYTLPDGTMQTITTSDLTYGVTGLNPQDTVNFQIFANSSNSCPGVISIEDCIAQNCPPIDITFNVVDTTLCNDASAAPFQLNAIVTGGPMVGGAVETWSGPGVDPMTGVFDPAVAGVGIHTIDYLYEESTCSETGSLTVRIIDQPTSDFSAPPAICVTNPLVINYDGSAPSLPFMWDADGTTVDSQGGNVYTAMWDDAGTYDISLQVGQGTCLSDITTITVQVDPEMDTVSISCTSTFNSITFDWTDVDCASEYQVFIDGNLIGTQDATDLSYEALNLNEGDLVEIEILPLEDCECPASPTTLVCEARACPPVELELSSPNMMFCEGTITTPFTLGVNVVNSEAPGTGQWSGNGINGDGTWNPSNATPGLYTFTYDYLESDCDFSNSITIEVLENPVAAAVVQDPDCYQDNVGSVEITGTGGTGDYDIYLNGNLITPADLTSLNPSNYNAQIVDDQGCADDISFVIQDAIAAQLDINGNTVIKSGNDGTLMVDVTSIDGTVDSVVWYIESTGEILCSGVGCEEITFNPEIDDTYCAVLYYNDGCTVEECADIKVIKTDVIILPNIITLNTGTGNNEFYVPEYETIMRVKSFLIYDRWGNKVFHAEDVPKGPGNGWDGKFNGTDVAHGVYVYAITLEMDNGDDLFFSGDVTVIK